MADKRVAIVQSNYIPWKGYFDLINSVDELILYDSVQYTRRDWRNRNRIKTRDGCRWLTIPVEVKGRYLQSIAHTRISDLGWRAKHLETVRHSYRRAPFFETYEPLLAGIYEGASSPFLSEVNERFIVEICRLLGITTTISRSSQYDLVEGRNERLISLCRQSGAQRYVSGPAARAYLETARFAESSITVEWMDYSGYPEYPQLHPPFEHEVTIIDLLLNVGPLAPKYMKSFGTSGATVSP